MPDAQYLLYVGTVQPRKNISTLVQAFHLLKKARKYQGKLVIAGTLGWMAEETMRGLRESRYANDIIYTGYVAADDLPVFYKAADMLVLPSRYEGFGIPLLEAMACGTPVAAADNSSLPEVVGKAGELFDPNDSARLATVILEVRDNRKALVERGLQRVRDFSWEKTARETLQVLEDVAKPST